MSHSLTHASSRLAARVGIRQVQALTRADRTGADLDAVILALWRTTLQMLKHRRGRAAAEPWRVLPRMLRAELARSLTDAVAWGHHSAARAVVQTLPEPHLRAACRVPIEALREAAEPVARTMTPPERDAAYSLLIFPPLSPQQTDSIVYAGNWRERLSAATSLAAPEQIAAQISQGYAAGETPQQIEKRLRPVVQQVRNSARRIARTEALRVAHQVQLQAWEQLGDQLIGYQCHSVLDQATRPWHAMRNGTIYYKDPGPGQKGLRQCPHPPEEPADPAERPAGTPQTAYNCRCYLSPVLRPLKSVKEDPVKQAVFTNAQGALVPDPATYADWWETAPRDEQRLAVGSRRYHLVASKLPPAEPLTWEHFLDPTTGDLLPLQRLKYEGTVQRRERVEKVRTLIGRLRELIRQAALFGFLSGQG